MGSGGSFPAERNLGTEGKKNKSLKKSSPLITTAEHLKPFS